LQNAAGVFFVLKAEKHVVGIPDHKPRSAKNRLYHLLKPQIEHLVKVDVRE
jgi:hypothetical protein